MDQESKPGKENSEWVEPKIPAQESGVIDQQIALEQQDCIDVVNALLQIPVGDQRYARALELTGEIQGASQDSINALRQMKESGSTKPSAEAQSARENYNRIRQEAVALTVKR